MHLFLSSACLCIIVLCLLFMDSAGFISIETVCNIASNKEFDSCTYHTLPGWLMRVGYWLDVLLTVTDYKKKQKTYRYYVFWICITVDCFKVIQPVVKSLITDISENEFLCQKLCQYCLSLYDKAYLQPHCIVLRLLATSTKNILHLACMQNCPPC